LKQSLGEVRAQAALEREGRVKSGKMNLQITTPARFTWIFNAEGRLWRMILANGSGIYSASTTCASESDRLAWPLPLFLFSESDVPLA
jgi:hypothetical protein